MSSVKSRLSFWQQRVESSSPPSPNKPSFLTKRTFQKPTQTTSQEKLQPVSSSVVKTAPKPSSSPLPTSSQKSFVTIPSSSTVKNLPSTNSSTTPLTRTTTTTATTKTPTAATPTPTTKIATATTPTPTKTATATTTNETLSSSTKLSTPSPTITQQNSFASRRAMFQKGNHLGEVKKESTPVIQRDQKKPLWIKRTEVQKQEKDENVSKRVPTVAVDITVKKGTIDRSKPSPTELNKNPSNGMKPCIVKDENNLSSGDDFGKNEADFKGNDNEKLETLHGKEPVETPEIKTSSYSKHTKEEKFPENTVKLKDSSKVSTITDSESVNTGKDNDTTTTATTATTATATTIKKNNDTTTATATATTTATTAAAATTTSIKNNNNNDDNGVKINDDGHSASNQKNKNVIYEKPTPKPTPTPAVPGRIAERKSIFNTKMKQPSPFERKTTTTTTTTTAFTNTASQQRPPIPSRESKASKPEEKSPVGISSNILSNRIKMFSQNSKQSDDTEKSKAPLINPRPITKKFNIPIVTANKTPKVTIDKPPSSTDKPSVSFKEPEERKDTHTDNNTTKSDFGSVRNRINGLSGAQIFGGGFGGGIPPGTTRKFGRSATVVGGGSSGRPRVAFGLPPKSHEHDGTVSADQEEHKQHPKLENLVVSRAKIEAKRRASTIMRHPKPQLPTDP